MIDPRIYRAGLVPAFFALIVAAFAVQRPPTPVSASLPPDSFEATRAFSGLRELASTFPRRRPGSPGDRALARRVAGVLRDTGFRVRTRRFDGGTALGERSLETVIGSRPGLSSREIVVVAHRDSLRAPGTAELSGTAALLELARIYEGRTLRKTLVLVSTSGGSGGAAGAAEAARHVGGPVDAVLAVGDVAGSRVRRPVVVPWSNAPGIAPVELRRTVEAAVRLETGLRPGNVGPAAQFARIAFPLTTGEQGELAAAGLPSVLVQASGERGPEADTRVSADRLGAFGRAVLRSITALDARAMPPRGPQTELLAAGKTLPGWTVRLVVGMLVLPVLLTTVDAFARARRRRHPVGMWLIWVLAGALPFALATLVGWLLSLTGLLPDAPPAPVPPDAVRLDGAAFAGLAAVALTGVVGWFGLRPVALRMGGVRGDPGSPGAATALALVLVAVTVVVWAANPFAAALLVAPLHAWVLLTCPEVHIRRSAALAAVAVSLLPAAVIVVYYMVTLGLAPWSLAWMVLMLVIGGHVGPAADVAWWLLLGVLVSVLATIRAQALTSDPKLPDAPPIRGPLSYAGPGSLGGTRSALRR